MAVTSKPLEAGPSTPLELLDSEKEIMAPLFQRRYVWADKQLDQLWSDIDAILDGEDDSRFLGAIVLVDQSSGLPFAPRSYWVIDGQQRITTVYMFLCAISELALAEGLESLAKDTVEAYLLNQKGKIVNHPKIRPTNRDLKQFADILARLKGFNPVPPAPFGDATGSLADAYQSILRHVRKECKARGSEYLSKLANVILGNLRFVQIVLSQNENPNQVYDSLNTRGERLGTIDLVRNEVFRRLLDDPQEAQRLFNSEWSEFEETLGKEADTYFFPFTLIHNPSVTKSRVFDVLRSRWDEWGAQRIIGDLMTYVPAFTGLVRDRKLEASEELLLAMDRLRRMPAPTTTYPFTIQVVYNALSGGLSADLAVSCLQLVESLLVRRAFAGFEPTGLHAVFKTLWGETGGDPEKLVQVIDKNPTITFPDDDVFGSDVKEKPLYRRKLAPYVIREYERGLKGGDPLPVDVPVTIDHVMPQTLSEEWQTVVDATAHEALVDTWANLVPLSQPFNSEKGQKDWMEVKRMFETETIFKTPRRLASTCPNWDESAIRNRAEVLASWAVERWPKRLA